MPLLTRTRVPKPTTPAATGLPDVTLLLLAMHDDAHARLRDSHPILTIGGRLGAQHRRQWAAEDLSRNTSASDADVAGAKRMIDYLNGLRAGCVDEIDAWCDNHLPASAVDVPLHTETVGSVVDRLAIASVRAEQLGTDRASAQLVELARAYSVLVTELATGTRRVPAWRTLKAYGSAR